MNEKKLLEFIDNRITQYKKEIGKYTLTGQLGFESSAEGKVSILTILKQRIKKGDFNNE